MTDAELIAPVRKWIDGGFSSWGIPVNEIAEICNRLETLTAELDAAERERDAWMDANQYPRD